MRPTSMSDKKGETTNREDLTHHAIVDHWKFGVSKRT
jgi:hypothetical protein